MGEEQDGDGGGGGEERERVKEGIRNLRNGGMCG